MFARILATTLLQSNSRSQTRSPSSESARPRAQRVTLVRATCNFMKGRVSLAAAPEHERPPTQRQHAPSFDFFNDFPLPHIRLDPNIRTMSRWLTLIYLCLLATSLQAAQSIKFDSLKVGSQVFSNVTVVSMNASDVYFTHDKGMSNAKLKYLDPDVQKKLGYDPKAAAAAESEHMREDAKFQSNLATKVGTRTRKNGDAANTPVSSEDNFADPVSPASSIGRPAPNIDLDKWLGEKPDLKDKFVLLSFWTTWSFPAKKFIPQLSALQKKFSSKLVVVAVTSESQDTVESMTDPKIDFPSAIDKGKLRSAFLVTAVPTVVLIDPKGVVLYQGHPAALTEKQLESILSKSE